MPSGRRSADLPFPAGRRERESRGRACRKEHADDRAQVVQAIGSRPYGEDRRELHGGPDDAAAPPRSRPRHRRRGCPPPTRRSASGRAAAGRSGSRYSTTGAPPTGPTGRSRAGWPSGRGSTRWRGTRRRSSRATSSPAACARSARRTTGSPSPPRGRWRLASSGSTTHSSRSAAPDSLAVRWHAGGADRHPPQVRSLRLGGRADARERHLPGQGAAKSTVALEHRRLADAARGGPDEGLLARAARRAQARARALSVRTR